MRPLTLPLLAVAVGTTVGAAHGGVTTGAPLQACAAALLAVGVYASTTGIDLRRARRDLGTIILAVTIGVALKATIIVGVLLLADGDPLWVLLGVAMAQIDPLSVAALHAGGLSTRARTVLSAWATFDDPVTVLLTVYAAPTLAAALGAPDVPVGGSADLLHLAANLALALVAWVGWRFARRRAVIELTILAVVLLLGALQFLMLGLALAGLFLRPATGAVLERATTAAFVLAALLLGLVLSNGTSIGPGIGLGVATFAAHAVVAGVLTRRMPTEDRLRLAVAQQNGITAIILGLLLERAHPGAIAVIAPAIATTNVLHVASNRFLDRRAPAPAQVTKELA